MGNDGVNSKALKAGMWYTISNFVIKGIGFITVPIFTRLLTKAEFGLLDNYNSWLSIFTVFVSLNLGATIISAKYDFKEKLNDYIYSMLMLLILSCGVWLVVSNAMYDLVKDLIGLDRVYLNAMIIYITSLAAIDWVQLREVFSFGYKKNVAVGLSLSISTALLSVLLVVFMQDKLLGRISGAVIPTFLFGMGALIYFALRHDRFSFSYWKYALPICLPYIPHVLSLCVLNSTDRIMIKRFCGAEDLSIYALAYTCSVILLTLMTALNNAYSPWLASKLSTGEHKEIRKVSRGYILIFAMIAILVVLVAPELLWILGGEKYADSVYVLAPILMGCICQFEYMIFVNVEQFSKKTIGMAIASVCSALLNFGLNLWLIPLYGYKAAAFTTLAGYLCLLGIHMFLVYRLGYVNIYSYKLILAVTSLAVIVSFTSGFLYDHSMLRYCILIVYSVFLIGLAAVKREMIFQFVKKLIR